MKIKVKASFLPSGHTPDKEYDTNPFKLVDVGTIEINEEIMDRYMNDPTYRMNVAVGFQIALAKYFSGDPES